MVDRHILRFKSLRAVYIRTKHTHTHTYAHTYTHTHTLTHTHTHTHSHTHTHTHTRTHTHTHKHTQCRLIKLLSISNSLSYQKYETSKQEDQ